MKNTDFLKNIASIIVMVSTIGTAAWFISKPIIDDYIKQEVEAYITSPAYKLQETTIAEAVSKKVFNDFLDSKEFNSLLDGYLSQANSNSVSLRKLLSLKMNVPQESVADELAELYTKDRKRLRNLLREINKMYPELNVWEID